MTKVEEKISCPLNVTPEQAWEVISAVKGVDKWFASMITSCRVEGDNRYCTTADGGKLEEKILEVNDETKTFRFAIPHQDVLPVENIVEEMKVKEQDGKALVEWSASFDVTEENAGMAREAFQGLCKAGLREMETYILDQTA